jgi:hypothetical protein
LGTAKLDTYKKIKPDAISVLPQTKLSNRDVTSLGNFVTVIMATDWRSEERVLQKKVVRFAGHFADFVR